MIQLGELIVPNQVFQQILDFLPYPFLISEYRGGTYHQIYLNDQFREEVGYTIEEIPTLDDWFLKGYPDPSYREEVILDWGRQAMEARQKGVNYILLKARIRTRDHGDQWFEVKSSTFGRYQLVAFVNIHEGTLREEELNRARENQNKMLSILSHDLRGPLNNLNSLAKLTLSADVSREEFMVRLFSIQEKSMQALEFLETTLQWTKSNFDQISIRREEVHVDEILKTILPVFAASYESKNITVTTSLETEETFTSDAEIVTIILRNLISNAIKFTPEGGTIGIRYWKKGEVPYIFVRDSGVGMSAEMIKRILSDQYSSQAGTRQEKGLGIGLKLCRDLLKKIGGSLEIESAPNKGTLMVIKIDK
jgi:signal transduction histidine kinase